MLQQQLRGEGRRRRSLEDLVKVHWQCLAALGQSHMLREARNHGSPPLLWALALATWAC